MRVISSAAQCLIHDSIADCGYLEAAAGLRDFSVVKGDTTGGKSHTVSQEASTGH